MHENEYVLNWLKQQLPCVCEENLPKNLGSFVAAARRSDCLTECPGIDTCPTHGYIAIPELSEMYKPPRVILSYRPCIKLVEAKRRSVIIAQIRNCGIPDRYSKASFENFKTLDRTHAIATAKAMAQECVSRGLSLTLTGAPGTGKTHLSVAMVRAWLAKGKSAVFVPVVALLDEIKRGFGVYNSIPKFEDAVKSADFIALDDLGAQYGSEWSTERLCELIDQRYRERRPMAITSNAATLEQLSTMVGSRGPQVISRLGDEQFGYFSPFMSDTDFRKLPPAKR